MAQVDDDLIGVVNEAWDQYLKFESLPFVVKPSVPILFFGNYAQYLASSLRIITVGLNPSHAEFPSDSPFSRFSKVSTSPNNKIIHSDYIQSLSDYYKINPYRLWFNCYEPILNGLEASYYGTEKNVVLHTDICTPLATDPTWSHLSEQEKSTLESPGYALWQQLISVLQPDIVLVSVARKYIEKLNITGSWETIYVVDRMRPYRVKTNEMNLPNGKKVMLIFGLAGHQPFATIPNEDKKKIGQKIIENITNRR
ncbi:MAG: hypothetical protein ACSLEX_01600 [Minisyncoccota bacterium]